MIHTLILVVKRIRGKLSKIGKLFFVGFRTYEKLSGRYLILDILWYFFIIFCETCFTIGDQKRLKATCQNTK